ncbi:TPA: hypothetical protein ROY02_005454 [Bacillus cereus]|nr:hypothetical protein [Bacillus cereus]
MKKTKCLKKILPILGLATLLATPNSSSAAIRDTDFSVGSSFPWSPYDYSGLSFTAYSDPYEMVGAFNNIRFDSTATNLHNSAYYLTLEINNVSDNLYHTGWYYTNLPDPGFDTDNDNGDQFVEEAEVYVNSLTAMIEAHKYYAFQTTWRKVTDSARSGTLNFIVQRSAWNPTNNEMEGIHYDLIDQTSWYLAPTLAKEQQTLLKNVKGINKPQETTREDKEASNEVMQAILHKKDGREKFSVIPKVNNKQELKKYKEKQIEIAQKIDSISEGVITFKVPLSIEQLQELQQKYNFKIKSYEIKANDQDGNWVTISGTQKGTQLFDQNKFDDVTRNQNVKFVGVTSAIVEMENFSADKLNSMQNDNNIFLVDISSEYVKQIKNDKNLHVRVPDLAWKIDKLQ